MVPRQHYSVEQTQGQQGVMGPLVAPSLTFQTLWRRAGLVLVIGIPLLILVVFVVYPLAAIILQSIFPSLYASSPSLTPSLNALRQVFAEPVNYSALVNSLWVSGITAWLATLLGTFLAILVQRTDLPLQRVMDTLVWLVFFTPSFLIGEAWSLVLIRGEFQISIFISLTRSSPGFSRPSALSSFSA